MRIGTPSNPDSWTALILANHMRALILMCAALIGIYCADQIFYSGTYTSATGQILQRIGHGFR